jgi:hypothetical protein
MKLIAHENCPAREISYRQGAFPRRDMQLWSLILSLANQ